MGRNQQRKKLTKKEKTRKNYPSNDSFGRCYWDYVGRKDGADNGKSHVPIYYK